MPARPRRGVAVPTGHPATHAPGRRAPPSPEVRNTDARTPCCSILVATVILGGLTLIAPYAVGFALVGLMVSLMTAKLVDDLTDTRSSKTRESIGQGVANIVTGFFGGMGGCAMIGQTMINVRNGARTRLSTFTAGVLLMVLCIVFGPLVSQIPMAALVAVMILVSAGTFDWHSIAPATLRRMPAGEIGVMVITVAVVVVTHDLAIGVVVGSLTGLVIFARRVAHLAEVSAVIDPDGGQVVYAVTGELFFASSNDLVSQFKYAARGKTVRIIGLNQPSARMHATLSGELSGSR